MNHFSLSLKNPSDVERYINSGEPLDIIDSFTDFTLFMYVCNHILHSQPMEPWSKVAMKMLDFGPEKINLKYKNHDGITALILVCGVDIDVSIKLINYGPEASNINAVEKDNKMNALMYACTPQTEDVAMEMLKYPQIITSLQNINNEKYTPLMIACEQGLEEVAITMLEKFPPSSLHLFQQNNRDQTAFDIAIEHEYMVDVYRLLNDVMNEQQNMDNIISTESAKNWAHKDLPIFPTFPTQEININGKGYDPIILEERNIKEYLEEDKKDNIVILYEDTNYLLSKSTIERQMEDAIVFECLKAEGTKNFPNIVKNIPLYNIKVIGIDIPQDKTGIWPEFIYMDGIELILNSEDQLFSIMPLLDVMFVSVMSLSESKKIGIEGSSISSLHCQNGQGGMGGVIIKAKASLSGGKKMKTKKRNIGKIGKKRKTLKIKRKILKRKTIKKRK